MRRLFLLTVITVLTAIFCAVSAHAQDTDSDGVLDAGDNCVEIANGPLGGPCFATGVQVDTDGDGSGDPCDGDFNNDAVVDSADQAILTDDLSAGTSTQGSGTDMNCDGAVDGFDAALFKAQIDQGSPGE